MDRWCLLLLAATAMLGLGWSVVESSDVIELDAASFADRIADMDVVLVEFYAPWCGHCKSLAPEYEKAATSLAKADPPIPLAKVDCPANTDLCGKYGVSGYPTLKIFRGGEFSADYQGPRNADGIVSYMEKQAGPNSREVDTVEKLKAFMDSEAPSVVGFFTDVEGALAKAFGTVAGGLRENFRFVHSYEAAVLTEFGYSDQVVIFHPPKQQTKMEPPAIVYDGKESVSAITTFIKTKFMGLAGVRTKDNALFFSKPLVVVYFEIDYLHNAKGSNYWRNRVMRVAKTMTDVTFAVSGKDEFAEELGQLGLAAEEVAVGAFDAQGMKYAMQETFSVDALQRFVEQFVAGELEPFIKSEPIPEENDGPVTVVVGKNFDEVVNDMEKDVLIEFYAPWCGHCKSLAPKWEELGEKLKDDPNIVIAKCDATANDVPGLYEVRGFPTIYWVPAGDKTSPEKYQGGRDVPDFIEFLKKKASHPLSLAGEKGKKGKEEL